MLASEFLELARTLSGGGPYESARLRSAISRSYYAAFLNARDHLLEAVGKRARVKVRGAHDKVWKAYQWAEGDLKVIGLALEALKGMREDADYELTHDPDNTSVLEAISISEKIQAQLPNVDASNCVNPDTGQKY